MLKLDATRRRQRKPPFLPDDEFWSPWGSNTYRLPEVKKEKKEDLSKLDALAEKDAEIVKLKRENVRLKGQATRAKNAKSKARK